jgi:2-(1,2-epoxy-1,2-dihydrophenyl)acetyl-CoA isomerase
VDDAELDEAAYRAAAGLAAGAAGALRAAKGLLRVGAGDDLRRHLAEEARSIAALADGREAQDRMASFLAARGRPQAGDGPAGGRETESVS